MRNNFAKELTQLSVQDDRIVLLSGDIGNKLFDEFKNLFPARFINCGVAEANMMGVAAGMALSGLRPIAYTINSFITARCLEQIRVDVCYHKAPVTIVGVGAGLNYASLGPTHHSCEDIAFLRALPGIKIICPGDPLEVREALKATLNQEGPVFIRLGKKGEPLIHKTSPKFEIGKSINIQMGRDISLLSTGTMLPEVLKAAEILNGENLSVRVESFHTVKPLDEECLKDTFNTSRLVVTVEEHSRIGGFGGAVSEWLIDQGSKMKKSNLICIGTTDEFLYHSGEQEYAHHFYHITAADISARILKALKEL